MKRFKNKIGVITGAGSGIGRSTALRLDSEGADLLMIDKNKKDLEATKKMLKNKSISGAFNFGPKHNDHLNVLQIYNLTNKLINKKIKYKTSKKFKSNKIFKESSFLALNSAKSKKILNWKSKYNSYDTVDKTILWYKNYYNKENMYDFSIKQIKEYLGEK